MNSNDDQWSRSRGSYRSNDNSYESGREDQDHSDYDNDNSHHDTEKQRNSREQSNENSDHSYRSGSQQYKNRDGIQYNPSETYGFESIQSRSRPSNKVDSTNEDLTQASSLENSSFSSSVKVEKAYA